MIYNSLKAWKPCLLFSVPLLLMLWFGTLHSPTLQVTHCWTLIWEFGLYLNVCLSFPNVADFLSHFPEVVVRYRVSIFMFIFIFKKCCWVSLLCGAFLHTLIIDALGILTSVINLCRICERISFGELFWIFFSLGFQQCCQLSANIMSDQMK